MTESTKTVLTVVRHGETEWNREGRIQGHVDSPFTERGIRQAEALAEACARRRFDCIYSSDLGRAFRTAELIAEKQDIPIITEVGLRERNLGIMQSLTMMEFLDQYPDEYTGFRSGDPDYVIPDGESVRQRYDRSIDCANRIIEMHVGENILIVTHGGVLESMFRHAVGIPLTSKRDFSLFNCALNAFSIADGHWRLDSWGDVRHLATVSTLDDLEL